NTPMSPARVDKNHRVLEIRRYQAQDHAAVLRVHRLALQSTGADPGPGPWEDDLSSPSAVNRNYLASGGEFLVGLIEGQLVAMGALVPSDAERVEIKRMRVHPDFQRCGYGRAILERLEAQASRLGCAAIRLETTTVQTEAIGLYTDSG